jgi:flagellar motor switch protein FliG
MPFEFLYNVPDDEILCWIAGEHPQTIAMILSYLPPRQAVAVLAGLSPEEQLSVVCRIATMEEPSPEVIRDVEEGLRSRFCDADDQPGDNRGIARLVRMLNIMEPKAERRLLDELTETDPALVLSIRQAMFGVEAA